MKKILFIYKNKTLAKKFVEHLKKNNYEVYEFFNEVIPLYNISKLQKLENIFHRFFRKDIQYIHKIYTKNFNNHSQKKLRELKKCKTKFDYCLVIRGDLVPEFVINHARSISKKMVDFQLDGLSVSSKILDYQKYFDDIFVFDPDDVKKYPEAALHFLPNCYFGEPDFSIPSEIDLLYIGQYLDERNVQLKNLHQYLEEHQLSYTSHTSLYRGRDFIPLHHKILHHKISTTYQENIDFVKKSKTLIDFKRDEHDGLSLRFFEAMQYGKKIITDNFSVKNYDFYHPNNIFVTNYVNLEGLVDFLQSPHQSLPSELVEKYSFKNWINTILNK
jgi:hypothetical protein